MEGTNPDGSPILRAPIRDITTRMLMLHRGLRLRVLQQEAAGRRRRHRPAERRGDDPARRFARLGGTCQSVLLDRPAKRYRRATQIFPFADPTSVVGYFDFETAVYRNVVAKKAA